MLTLTITLEQNTLVRRMIVTVQHATAFSRKHGSNKPHWQQAARIEALPQDPVDVSRGPPFGSFPCWRPLLVRASRGGANASLFGRPSETERDRSSSVGTWQLDERADSRLLAITDPSCDSHVRRVGFFPHMALCSAGWFATRNLQSPGTEGCAGFAS